MNDSLRVELAPLLPTVPLYGLIIVAIILLLSSFLLYKRGIFTRTICAAAFLLLILNPSLITEKREPVKDVAVIVVDRSQSQNMGNRREQTDKTLADLQARLSQIPELDVRTVDNAASGKNLLTETRLFEGLNQALADVPLSQRAGVFFITDGQIHDIPSPERFDDYGPVHGLLSGHKNEHDRHLVILEAPSYGLVGETVTIRYRIDDTAGDTNHISLSIRQDNEATQIRNIPANTEQTLDIKIRHAGQNIIDLDAAVSDSELTASNNRVPIIINGVRDRLRVLLVSGQPHAGGRTWRNLLTSDPGVDLVHFTILREPNKLDATPQHELSLIEFPVHELFETKLYDFDLIIFDRYRLNRILPNYYFSNIARYVKEGGALLEASGPSYAGEDSVYNTALQQVLPASPAGRIYKAAYKPVVTDIGNRHPVTQNLTWSGGNNSEPGWGSWLRQITVSATHGDILMDGANEQPLLILDRVNEGRVAQLASDHIWLWSSGFEGGGPQAELLRRLSHWLMKEPELEENALSAKEKGGTLVIQRRSLDITPMNAKVIAPDGTETDITLEPSPSGTLEARIPADQLGVYVVDDGTQQRFALAGSVNPPELQAIRTTEEKLRPITDASKGRIAWSTSGRMPDIRIMPESHSYSGRTWIGLRKNDSYIVSGVTTKPFLPAWLYALLLSGIILGSWYYEGKTKP